MFGIDEIIALLGKILDSSIRTENMLCKVFNQPLHNEAIQTDDYSTLALSPADGKTDWEGEVARVSMEQEQEREKQAKEISELKKDHEGAINELKEEHRQAIEQLEDKHKSSIEKLQKDHNLKIEELNDEHNKAIKKLEDVLKEELSKKQSVLASLIGKLSAEDRYNLNLNDSDYNDNSLLFKFLQQKEAERLYVSVRNRIKNNLLENIDVWKSLLEKVFEFYIEGTKSTIINPKVGSAFNSAEQSNKSGAQTTGVVAEVMLFGYKDATGKVIQQAMVKVN